MKKEYLDGRIIAYCGDCLDIIPTLPKVDLVLTDPPYKQEFHGRGMSKDRPNYQKISDYGSDKKIKFNSFFDLCLEKLNEINFFTFCDKETKYDFITIAKNKKLGYKELCFCKTAPTPFTNNQWLSDVEFGLHIFKNLKVRGSYKTKRTFSVLTNLREETVKDHPSPKKISEIRRILRNISDDNSLILDAFGGSGTTAVACIKENRRCIIIEKDPDYFKIMCSRIEDAIIEKRSEFDFGEGEKNENK